MDYEIVREEYENEDWISHTSQNDGI